MANLKKLLVHVPSSLCDGFKTKYVTAETNRDTSYDSKIVFLEKTQEIFAKGKIYSTSVIDFNSLQQLVSSLQELVGDKLPEGVTSTNIIDYIAEVKEELIGAEGDNPYVNTIQSAKTLANYLADELKGSYADSYTKDTIWGAKAYAGNLAYNLIGYSGDNYTADTIYGAKNYARYLSSNSPVVAAGTGITVTPSTSGIQTTFTISTYPDIFHYNGNKTTISELPSVDNIKGDVWSVGADKAAGSVLYAWDGDEWINIGSPNSVTGVDTTDSYGISLSKTADGRVKVNAAPGSVEYNDTSVVTGGEVYRALEEASKYDVHNITSDYTYISCQLFNDQYLGKSYMIELNEDAIFNYVSENFWETYKV